ncbi:MAG: FecR domain-containing protein [Verrucomicrobiota bacterium]
MSDASSSPSTEREAIEAAASDWVLRQDRGLTPTEQDEFSHWLAADARHGAAFAACRWGWEELDRLAGIQSSVHAVPDPDLLAPVRGRETSVSSEAKRRPLGRVIAVSFVALAAAAALVVGISFWQARPEVGPAMAFSRLTNAAPCERRTLEDGSVVELNRGAELVVQFTAGERRVRLERGEAHFTVTKNPERPFIVSARGAEARAVGTAFNVRVAADTMEVVVTEGRVRVDAPGAAQAQGAAAMAVTPIVEVGQRAVVPLGRAVHAAAQVVTLSAAEMEARLAWQPRMLDFNGEPLTQIVAAFNRHNPVQLAIADPALQSLRLSAAFRSDNVAGFVRLMEAEFGMRAEWRGETKIALTRAK